MTTTEKLECILKIGVLRIANDAETADYCNNSTKKTDKSTIYVFEPFSDKHTKVLAASTRVAKFINIIYQLNFLNHETNQTGLF